MTICILFVFVIGYLAIAMEHQIRVNKAASALLTGTLCWAVYVIAQSDKEAANLALMDHMGELAGILFFLLGAMTIVELIDAHDGFQIITERIKTKKATRLLWLIAIITFFLSAILDNLTTTIVMLSLMRKLIADQEKRLFFAGMVVIAANAGGAWSPMGDVTTTMLWIGGQVSAWGIISEVFFASLVSLFLPLLWVTRTMKGNLSAPTSGREKSDTTDFERKAVFWIGLGSLLFVPVFKTVTHLPPFMAILFGLGLMWLLTEWIHSGKDEVEKGLYSVVHALRKIDTPSILFFLGILLSIAALESSGVLHGLAEWLDHHVGNQALIVMLIGALSAVVDNVPLVAATQGMYSLEVFPKDGFFWSFLAFATGTGGSMLIIGSAAGVAAMGLERIQFVWYLKKISWLALLGYLGGCLTYVLQYQILH